MANFCKNESCPPSEDLLAFGNGDMPLDVGRLVREHLAVCEFCASEVEFYQHYPQEDEIVQVESIPAPLFDLAEALLNREKSTMPSLDELLDRGQPTKKQ